MMKNSKSAIDFHKTNVTKPPKEKEGKQEKSQQEPKIRGGGGEEE